MIYLISGNGIIDIEEFEYVLSDFGVSGKEARQVMISCQQKY